MGRKFEVDFVVTYEGQVEIESKDSDDAEEKVYAMGPKKLMELAQIDVNDGTVTIEGVEEEDEEE